jgi:hypothetical protein
MGVERVGDFCESPRGYPRLEKLSDLTSVDIARALITKVDAVTRLDSSEAVPKSCRLAQIPPLTRRKRDEDHVASVRRSKIPRIRAKEMVSKPGSVFIGQQRLLNEAEVVGNAEGHIGERELHKLTFARQATMSFGSENPDRCEESCTHIPRREHVINGAIRPFGAGHKWEAKTSVYRVVNGGTAVGCTGDENHNETWAPSSQRVIVCPTGTTEIGDEDTTVRARSCHERCREFLPPRQTQVERHRALAAVETTAVKAAAFVEWPPPCVDAATSLLDADHLCTQGGERRACKRRGDERGKLHHPKA